jgi:hypothetical protein
MISTLRRGFACLTLSALGCSASAGDLPGSPQGPAGGSSGTMGTGATGSGSPGAGGDAIIDLGGGPGPGPVGDGEECAGVVNRAEKRAGGKADIIFALDNSGSMLGEALAVQSNLNTFSQLIVDSQIDAHVVMISSGPPTPPPGCDPNDPFACLLAGIIGLVGTFVGPYGVCIEPPLGAPGACPDGDDSNPATGYLHVFEEVASRNALSKIQETYSRWQHMLRPDAAKTFVVITDDDNRAPPTIDEFTTWVDAQPVFASAIWRFSGVYCLTDGSNCARAGEDYNILVPQTGGVAGNMANFSDQTINQEFAAVFNSLADAIIADAVPVDCEWIIPPPPPGESLDPNKVNVLYTSGTGGTQTIFGVPAAECPPASEFLGWYYDNPTHPQQVIACPETCAVLQGDDGAQIEVQFGCDREPPPIR